MFNIIRPLLNVVDKADRQRRIKYQMKVRQSRLNWTLSEDVNMYS